ncbi:hypothetical protein LF1_07230 [Rubripirellula obstinata]|uniref:Uncharacterized protein n=1 Tax=Rubripirellula obstinata TaxID=406547 RepID=A0A5B1CAP7_9BACT|nr:hypothetical protein [Rubripirellula obstinata]KAA1258207.1 hypothetical protein LF1_07230 [Rubripirellula obstinata]
MAWRPTHLMQSGELDNTTPGWTIGWLKLDGFESPLQLKLAGNCHPDLAGWKFRIHRIEPELIDEDDDHNPDYSGIKLDQSGHVGDITADQMIKHFDIPTSELLRRMRAGEKPPFTWRKCLYLEWYSNANGRAVIQSTRLEVERVGERAFELTEEQWKEQSLQNADEMNHFMAQLGDALEERDSTDDA